MNRAWDEKKAEFADGIWELVQGYLPPGSSEEEQSKAFHDVRGALLNLIGRLYVIHYGVGDGKRVFKRTSEVLLEHWNKIFGDDPRPGNFS